MHVLRYLNKTTKLEIYYPKRNLRDLIAYVDACWRCDVDSKRSTSSLLYMIANSPLDLNSGSRSECGSKFHEAQATIQYSCKPFYSLRNRLIQHRSMFMV